MSRIVSVRFLLSHLGVMATRHEQPSPEHSVESDDAAPRPVDPMQALAQDSDQAAVLRNIIATIPFSIFWKDRDSVYVGCNEQFARHTALASPSAIVGKSDFDLPWTRAQAEQCRERDREVMEAGLAQLDIEESLRLPGGDLRIVSTSKVPLRSASGTIVGVLGISADITHRKNTEQQLALARAAAEVTSRSLQQQARQRELTESALRMSEARLRTVIASAPIVLLTYDQDARLTFIEGMGLESVGLPPESLLGKSVFELFPHRPDILEAARRSLAGESGMLTIDVRGLSFEIRYNPKRDAGGRQSGVIGVATDVTERNRVESELRRAKEAAEQAGRVKTDFLANMSHELRTPLNAIVGFSRVLASKQASLDPTDARCIRNIHQSAEHMLSLINDLLDLRRLEDAPTSLDPETVSLSELARAAVSMLEPLIRERQLSIVNTLDEHMLTAWADRRALLQVILNLLSNAVKFTPPTGRIELHASHLGDTVEFSIKDTGVGIASDDLAHVFEYFRQFGAKHEHGMKGSGVGLALTKKIVELLGGTIRLESQVGVGSTFHVRLPAGSMGRRAA